MDGDFKLTITYPSNFTLSESLSPTVTLTNEKVTSDKETILNDPIIKNNAQIFTDELTTPGYYTIKSIILSNEEKGTVATFNHENHNVEYCRTAQVCIISNVSQTILIDKDDDDKQEFMIPFVGLSKDTTAQTLKIQAGEHVLSDCSFDSGTKTIKKQSRIYCKLQPADLEALKGGEDRDKAISYPISFIPIGCEDHRIKTKITMEVVAGNYISLNRYSLVISLLFFFFFL